ncbi:MAG: hypothetical protein ACOCV2_04305 [Persicimonas sp.]
MISSKILVQSATAGLMAGAVVTLPWLWTPEDDTCSFGDDKLQEVDEHVEFDSQPKIEARRVEQPRSVEARNRDAREALEEIEELDHESEADKAARRQLEREMTQLFADRLAKRIDGQTRTRLDGQRTADRVSEKAAVELERVDFR